MVKGRQVEPNPTASPEQRPDMCPHRTVDKPVIALFGHNDVDLNTPQPSKRQGGDQTLVWQEVGRHHQYGVPRAGDCLQDGSLNLLNVMVRTGGNYARG